MKPAFVNVYADRGRPEFGYCRFKSAKAAKRQRNPKDYAFTIQVTKNSVKIVTEDS